MSCSVFVEVSRGDDQRPPHCCTLDQSRRSALVDRWHNDLVAVVSEGEARYI